MKNLFDSASLLLLDMASTFVFLIIFLVTKSMPAAVAAGMVFGAAQIGWYAVRKQPIDTMQWMSLFVVIVSGTAALLTHDPRFVMIKPSLIYVVIGVVMLRRGWINRYLPAIALELVGDVAIVFGYIWSGLMFVSAVVNIVLALKMDPVAWASVMSIYAIVSKAGLFGIQYATMRYIGGRRHRKAELAGAVAA
jgi:intracellular septation protein